MAAFFLTARFPWALLQGRDVERFKGTYEKHPHVFYQTDSREVAERLKENLLTSPAVIAGADSDATLSQLYAIVGQGGRLLPFVFIEIIDAADLRIGQRVALKDAVDSVERWRLSNPPAERFLDIDSPNGRRLYLLWAHYFRAVQLEVLIRREMGLPGGPSTEPTQGSATTSLGASGDQAERTKEPDQRSYGPDSALERRQVFVSYNHKDARWLERLKTMLHRSIAEGKLDLWDDTRIMTGDGWRKEIREALSRAKVAVLLVSPDFLASGFINKHELPPLLKAAGEGGLRIFWIPVRHCMYEQTEIAEYQAAHNPGQPLADLSGSKREKAIKEICKKLLDAYGQSE